jgi:hypothetical protein
VRVLALAVAGKAQPCRYWAQDVVTAAQAQVEAWRAIDRANTGRRRPAAPVA